MMTFILSRGLSTLWSSEHAAIEMSPQTYLLSSAAAAASAFGKSKSIEKLKSFNPKMRETTEQSRVSTTKVNESMMR